MTTPELFEQLLLPRARKTGFRSISTRQLSAETVSSAGCDAAIAIIAGLLSFQLRFAAPLSQVKDPFGHATLASPRVSALFLLVFAGYVVLLSERLGLYQLKRRMSLSRETVLTLQAVAGSGLLLSGTLFATRGYAISRVVVGVTVALTFVMVAVRRLLARHLERGRHLRGLEVRNVLIVGHGRVAHALRNHFAARRDEGLRFKGFISTAEDRVDSTEPELIGSLQHCISLARSLLIDEIYFTMPGDRNDIVHVAEQARSKGVDVFVVPDLYDGLAWNAPVEYVGQFPTLRLQPQTKPSGNLNVKHMLDLLITSAILLLTFHF